MVRTLSSSSSSSCASFGSFDDGTISNSNSNTIKFLCSYGGRIVPRHSDGKLRYVGGDTRVLTVDRSTSFSELHVKLKDLCGWESVRLRFQLPADDLYDALVTITSDEDLANFFEEFDLAMRVRSFKIQAFLFPEPSQTPKAAPCPSPSFPPSASMKGKSTVQSLTPVVSCSHRRIHHQISAPMRFSGRFAGDPRVHGCCIAHGSPWPHQYLVHQY